MWNKSLITGLYLEESDDGYYFLLDSSTNQRVFAIEKPFMIDSSIPEGFVTNMEQAMPEGAWSDQIEMDVQQEGNKLFIKVKPDMEWLQSKERVYPVTIDPTVKVYQPKFYLNDTTIRSSLPDTTGGADTELGAGFYSLGNNIVRSLLNFDVGALPKGAKIMNAQLNLRLSSVWNETATIIQLHEMNNAWEENRATWNRRTLDALWANKGGDFNSSSLSSQTVGALDTTAIEPQLFKWTINPDIIQKWMDQPSQNVGLMLKASNETTATYKKFYSGDNSGKLEYSPKLTITYFPLSRLGLESYWSYAEHSLTDGQGYVNLGTGNLVLDFNDFSISGRGSSGFSFNRTYNSKAVEDSPIGYGWSFTGNETVAEFPNKDVIYTQSDGTVHRFTYDVANAKYISPAGLYLTLTKANLDAFVITDFNGNRVVYRDLIKNPENQGRIYPIDYEEDRNKNKITYVRQADGTLTGITDASGRTLTLEYNNGRIVSTSFEGTKKSAYTYEPNGRLKTSVIFEDSTTETGSLTTYSYNGNGELESVLDANNQITKYTYINGFLTNVLEPTISQTGLSNITYTYDIANYKASEIDALGNETKYEMNANYIIKTITDPMLYTSSFNYDPNYNLLDSTDPEGNITVNTYDSKGNLLTTTDALKNTTVYTYNDFSQPLTITDANGTVTYGYNSYGDVTSELNTLGETTSYSYYEPYGNLKSMTLPDGTTENYDYDLNKNYPTQHLDALNRKTSTLNDKYGNVKNVTDARGNDVDYEYDEQNLLKSMTDEKGTKTNYGYDDNGNLTTITNGLNRTTILGYNNQNQYVSRIEPLGQTTSYEYDAAGNMVKEIKPIGNTTITTEHDDNSRPKYIRVNGYLKWQYGYDKNGNTTSIINGETSASSTLLYDVTDKLKSESYGKQNIEYDYSPTETLTDIKGTSNTSVFTQKFIFDLDDQLKNIYRNGAIQTAYDYTKNGEPYQRRYVNGVHTNYEYDDAQQLENLNVIKGSAVLLDETPGYDLNGNITSVTSPNGLRNYSYDAANQLESQSNTSTQFNESYTYDVLGNRLSKSTANNWVYSYTSYEYDHNNRLAYVNGQPYTYNDNGNRIEDSKYTYQYNKFDQLTSIQNKIGTVIASYAYDDRGRRKSKLINGKTTYYHYDQGINVLFETDSTGNITTEYVYDPDGMPLIMTKGGQNYYYVYNVNKEIVSLTNASGAVVASYTYDAWGNILSQTGSMATENQLRYKGYRYDEETGLYYLIARYYQPAEGVFLTTDPQGGDVEDAKTQNGYNYANNNPVMMSDPDGEYAWLVINAGFAAYDGYKAYKSGKASGKKGWALAGSVAWASGSSFAKVGHLKKAGKALKFINGTRRTGVNRAWKEERAMIAKTGQGTRKWSGKRRKEILEDGKANGMIGHHINSVKSNPDWAGLAKNVRFVSKKQHYRLHGGNWRTQTTGRFINRR